MRDEMRGWIILGPDGPLPGSNADTRPLCIRMWLAAWRGGTEEYRTWANWRRMGFRCVRFTVERDS